MKELRSKLGEMEYDGLIADLNPPVRVEGRTIGKLAAETVLPRGALLSKNDAGLCALYDGTGTPDCILCEDATVGTEEDVDAAVYAAGCFDPAKVTLAEGCELTDADRDKLRGYNIIFKAVSPA